MWNWADMSNSVYPNIKSINYVSKFWDTDIWWQQLKSEWLWVLSLIVPLCVSIQQAS